MAKIAVRDRSGVETTMSLSRAREAVAAGSVTYVKAPKAKKAAAKKVAKKATKKTATKSVATRNRSMAGRARTK